MSWSCSRSLCEPAPSFPQSCLANIEWGQLLLALVLSTFCCPQVFNIKHVADYTGKGQGMEMTSNPCMKLLYPEHFPFIFYLLYSTS